MARRARSRPSRPGARRPKPNRRRPPRDNPGGVRREAMKHYSTRETAQILDATEAEVRNFARLGRIEASRGADGGLEFTFQQLLLLKTTKGLIDAGVPPRRMRSLWTSLRRQIPDDVPLT